MDKTAIFFGPLDGAVHRVAKKIKKTIGEDKVAMVPVKNASVMEMMKTYKFRGHPIRVVRGSTDVWFCGKDICTVIYIRPSKLHEYLDLEDSKTFNGETYIDATSVFYLADSHATGTSFQKWVTCNLPLMRRQQRQLSAADYCKKLEARVRELTRENERLKKECCCHR